MPVILVTQETEIQSIEVQSQPGQIISDTLSQKNPTQKRTGGVVQGCRPSSNPSTAKKKKTQTLS
jgi:hypothetical protein